MSYRKDGSKFTLEAASRSGILYVLVRELLYVYQGKVKEF